LGVDFAPGGIEQGLAQLPMMIRPCRDGHARKLPEKCYRRLLCDE
jgi:hypothetical protein